MARAWAGARPFRIQAKRVETRDTTSIALAPADGSAPAPFEPGQYLTVEVPLPGGAPLVRCYSLSNAPGEPVYRITVKAEPPRAARPSGSTWLVRDAKVGDTLGVRAPEGDFTLDAASQDPVVLVGGGIGVTPFASMLLTRARTGSRRPLHLVYGARRGAEAPLKAELESAAKATGARLHVLFSQPDAKEQPGRDFERAGRATTESLQALIPPGERPYDFYLCGPPAMLHDLSAGLESLGVPSSKVHVEVFGATGVHEVRRATRRVKVPGAAPAVEFARSKKKATWDPAQGALMYLAEREGVAIPYACAAGRCGTCLTALVSGAVDYAVKPGFGALFPGYCLPCVATPRTSVVLDC